MSRPLASLVSGLLAAALVVAAPQGARAQGAGLEAFGLLVIGAWEAADARHVFEWGVDRRLVRSRSYAPDGAGGWSLVSEGMWYWDGVADVVRGLVLATGMPVDRFEYTSRVQGATVRHDLAAHGEGVQRYRETWTFGEDGYAWTLEAPTSDGYERVMGGEVGRVVSGS